MGYITVDTTGGGIELKFRPEMWIFFTLTLTLLMVTVGFWLLVDFRRQRRAARQNQEEKC
jgi:flagellar biogenesis protein FliO